MWIVKFPTSCPVLFWLLATVWSLFQGYTRREYGLYIFDSVRKDDINKRLVRDVAYGIHHGLFYFLCSFSGFVAWRLADQIAAKIGNRSEVAAGTGAILVALALVSIAGIAGASPRILYLGNRLV